MVTAGGVYQGHGAVQRDGGSVVMPIAALNPYQNKWTIRCRLMEKGDRSYSNAKGDGKLFNLTVVDSSGEIRITGFTETHTEHYERLAVGRCYEISGGTLKPKNAQYNYTSHGFEVTLNRGCKIEEVADPEGNEAIPRYNYSLTPIAALEHIVEDTKVDVLGVVMECTEPNTFTAKSGKEMTKRTMHLADTSGRAIECTIFGQPSKNIVVGNAVAIKAAKVGSWNGKSLTLWEDAAITIHPDMQEAHSLLGWWQTQQQSGHSIVSISNAGGGGGGGSKPARRIVFADIDEQALGLNAEPDYFEVKCTITFIKTEGRTMWYIACPNCKKKLGGAQEEDLQGHCEKCDKTTTGIRRWIFQATCNDATGSRFVSFFDNEAVQLLGKTADELAPLKVLHDNQPAFDAHFTASSFSQCILKCRVKNETYMDEQRLKISVVQLTPLDYLHEGRALLQEIRQLQGFA